MSDPMDEVRDKDEDKNKARAGGDGLPGEVRTRAARLTRRGVARITLQALSPLSIGSGRRSDVFDVQVARDANGLPCIPGTALAGVLRAAMREAFDEALAQSLFGYAGATQSEGEASRVWLTSAHVHDARDIPVDGLCTHVARLLEDPILGPFLLADEPKREHVRLDHAGVVDGEGKFDRGYVPRGHRFTFDLMFADEADGRLERDFEALLAAIASPHFRLGGATRCGYGQLQVIACQRAVFDLRQGAEFEAFAALPARLDQPFAAAACERALPQPWQSSGWCTLALRLEAEDFWRVGTGRHAFTSGDKDADMLPYSERGIEWDGGRGWIGAPVLVVPAASIKGALAHRVAYHASRLAGRFADRLDDAAFKALAGGECPEVRLLFGCAKNKTDASTEHAAVGWRGVVSIDDVVIPKGRFGRMMHNSIDRFTGGTRDGVLYAEELVFGGSLELKLHIDFSALDTTDDTVARALRALEEALSDLGAGRLAIGAAQARGHGFFRSQTGADALGRFFSREEERA